MSKSINKKNISATSWVAVGLLLYFFFPVGIYFLLRKLRKEPQNYKANATVAIAIGGIFLFVAVFYLINAAAGNVVADSETSVWLMAGILLLLCCAVGGPLVALGLKYRRLGLLMDRYYPRIIHSEDGDLDSIAAAAGLPRDVVYGDLLRLIGAGALGDSYIDEATGKLQSALVGSGRTKAPQTPTQMIVCPHCGGKTRVIPGAVNQCEYCDSQLS